MEPINLPPHIPNMGPTPCYWHLVETCSNLFTWWPNPPPELTSSDGHLLEVVCILLECCCIYYVAHKPIHTYIYRKPRGLAFDWMAFLLYLVHIPETRDSFLILQKPNIYNIYNTRASRSGSYSETREAIRRWMRFGSEAPRLFWFQFRCERRFYPSIHLRLSGSDTRRDSVKNVPVELHQQSQHLCAHGWARLNVTQYSGTSLGRPIKGMCYSGPTFERSPKVFWAVTQEDTVQWNLFWAVTQGDTVQWNLFWAVTQGDTVQWNLFWAVTQEDTVQWNLFWAVTQGYVLQWTLLGGHRRWWNTVDLSWALAQGDAV